MIKNKKVKTYKTMTESGSARYVMCFLYNTALYKYLCIILIVTIVAAAAVAAAARVELESNVRILDL